MSRRLEERVVEAAEAALARHAGARGSGRVGRSAAGRALDEEAVRLAVVASVRHEDTQYDELLMAGVPRAEARERVRPAMDRVLERWSGGSARDSSGGEDPAAHPTAAPRWRG